MIREIFLKFIEPLADRFEDENVNEIRINPNGTVYEERDGQIHQAKVSLDPMQIKFAVKSLSGFANQPLTEGHPKLDVRLPSGERVAILAPPVVTPGYAVTIRRFPKAYTLHQLVHQGSLTAEQADLLVNLVQFRRTLLVSGHPGSGKTTVVRVLLNQIPLIERLLVIEDPAELNLNFSTERDMVAIELQPEGPNGSGFSAVDALKAALRHSPCRIIVGELRGGEAATFLEALNTGRPGSLTTLHANSAEDALDRLITLVRRGDPLAPRDVIVDTIAKSVHVVAHMELLNGRRMLTGLVQVTGVSDDHTRVLTTPIFAQKKAHA